MVLHELPRDDASATPANIADDEWHHVLAVLDVENNRFQLFVDGELNASMTTSDVPIKTSGNIRLLGGWNDVNELLSGSIDEFRLYNRILSTSEIEALGKKTVDLPWDLDNDPDQVTTVPITGEEEDLVVGIRFDDDQASSNSRIDNQGDMTGTNERGLTETPANNAGGAEDFTARSNPDFAAIPMPDPLNSQVRFTIDNLVPLGRETEDTDGDNLDNWFELTWPHLDPFLSDTDGDGIIDSEEDTDNDLCSERAEQIADTNPLDFGQ